MSAAYTVMLSHTPNPDVAPGGYWQGAQPQARCAAVHVSSVQAARAACATYIAENGLGAGNWSGGVVTRDGQPLAWVSYNGRAWYVTPGADPSRHTFRDAFGTAWSATDIEVHDA